MHYLIHFISFTLNFKVFDCLMQKNQFDCNSPYNQRGLCWWDQESILPTYFLHFSSFFQFLLLSLGILKYRQYCLMLQTVKLNNKNRKKSFFYKEKSLVGLTPGPTKEMIIPIRILEDWRLKREREKEKGFYGWDENMI